MEDTLLRFYVVAATLLPFSLFSCGQQTEKAAVEDTAQDDLRLGNIPQVVMDGLKDRFLSVEIRKWTIEKEGDIVVYDIEFEQDGRKFEADIKEDGSIHNWEKAIEVTDLSDVVKMAADMKYPKSTINEIMEITAVMDGKDVLEGYEIVLETDDMKEVEITVASDGNILEDSGETKPKGK